MLLKNMKVCILFFTQNSYVYYISCYTIINVYSELAQTILKCYCCYYTDVIFYYTLINANTFVFFIFMIS